MKQSSLDLNLSTKKTHKQKLLAQMDLVVAWAALVELSAPYYTEGKDGRPTVCSMVRRQTSLLMLGYQGAQKLPDAIKDVTCHVTMRPGMRKELDKQNNPIDALIN